MKCPGQDSRYWRFEDIFDVLCPNCHEPVEFFRDDPSRPCHCCGQMIGNPRLNTGCAEHCSFAGLCARERSQKRGQHES